MKFEIGSRAFFKEYPDFDPHDSDYVLFEDNPVLYKTFVHIKEKGNSDIFAYKIMNKQEFLDFELEHCKKAKMAVGKLLVPEIIEYFGLTIEDLMLFRDVINNIDDKHTYEKIIYDAYIENNNFTLTKEQRDNAYKEYKSKR